MIRDIVFDLGNVLISFKPAEYLEKNNYPENLRKSLLADVFGSREWLLIDDGKLSVQEAINLISVRSSLPRTEINAIFEKRTEILYPIGQNIDLLPGLKETGFTLYFLSNFPLDIFDEVKMSYPFFKLFDGGIISAEAGFSKPYPEIYNLLLQKYDLTPSEILYIDDLEVNVRTAVSLGMKGLITWGSHNISEILSESLHSVARPTKG